MTPQANVLLVEGDEATRAHLRDLLRALPYALVGEASDGRHGLSLARSLRPDVVLLNVDLPELAGGDVVRYLETEQIAPAVLLTHAGRQDWSPNRLADAGAMGCLTLPPRTTDLEAALCIAVAHWRRLRSVEEELRATQERMEARRLVGRAKAILMERHSLQEREAFRRIQSQSAALGKPVHEVAKAIITASEIAA